MKVIVEGPDGGGKSTLLMQLRSEFPGKLMERVVDKDTNPMVDLKRWVEEDVDPDMVSEKVFNELPGEFVFYDRHRLISEPIYGPILRIRQYVGFDDYKWLEKMLRCFRAQMPIIVYCLPPLPVVINNIRHDPDNTRVLERIEAIYTAYLTRAALDKLSLWGSQVFIYDYTHPDPTMLRIRAAMVNLTILEA